VATDVAAIIADARSKLGSRYVFGAEGPDVFDCSGLMQWVFGQHGVKLPRVAADQAKAGQRVSMSQLRPGDLIFSTWDSSPDVDHVALYIGGGEYIHAPRPGDVVKVSKINDTFRSHVTNVQRVTDGGDRVPIPGGGIGLPGVGGDLVGALADVAGGVRTMAGGITQVGDLARKLGWFALPTTQVRLVTGAFGVGFLLAGVWLLTRAAVRA